MGTSLVEIGWKGGDVLPGVVGAGEPKLQSLNMGTWKGVPLSIVTLIFGGEHADTNVAATKTAGNMSNIRTVWFG